MEMHVVRGQKVLLDSNLALLYGVPTKRFNEQVKRNQERFPDDFMFQLSQVEFDSLRSHFATSKNQVSPRGGRRYLPYAFTEHGAIMAAMILNSARATQVSVYVVRAFVQLREVLVSTHELSLRLDKLEGEVELMALEHETSHQSTKVQLKQIFDILRELMQASERAAKRPIGFIVTDDKPPSPDKG
jgi:hypothetical protein